MIYNICNITREWLTRTPRSRALKIRRWRKRESLSAATDLTPCSRWPTSLWATPKPTEWRSQVPWDSPTSTWGSAAEDLLAVKVPRLGTTGKWPSSSATSTLSALLARLKKSPPLPSPTASKSASILGLPPDCQLFINSHYSFIHVGLYINMASKKDKNNKDLSPEKIQALKDTYRREADTYK